MGGELRPVPGLGGELPPMDPKKAISLERLSHLEKLAGFVYEKVGPSRDRMRMLGLRMVRKAVWRKWHEAQNAANWKRSVDGEEDEEMMRREPRGELVMVSVRFGVSFDKVKSELQRYVQTPSVTEIIFNHCQLVTSSIFTLGLTFVLLRAQALLLRNLSCLWEVLRSITGTQKVASFGSGLSKASMQPSKSASRSQRSPCCIALADEMVPTRDGEVRIRLGKCNWRREREWGREREKV